MALQKNTVSIPLVQGLQTKRSDKFSEPGSLSNCSNLEINKIGELEKRRAFQILNTPGASSTAFDPNYPLAGESIVRTGSTLGMLDGQRLYSSLSDGKYKDIGEAIPAHLDVDIIQESSQAKCGPISYERVISTAGVFNVYLWTQTVPLEADDKQSSRYESYFLIRSFDEETVIHGPSLIISSERKEDPANNFATDQTFLNMGPHTQMLYSPATDKLYFFSHDSATSTNISVRFVNLGSASPTFTLQSGGNIVTDLCLSAANFTVASHNQSNIIYLAYYSSYISSSVNRPSNLKLLKCTEAGSGFTVNVTESVTNSVYNTADSQHVDQTKFLGTKANIALRVLADTQDFPVFIAYSVYDHTANNQKTFVEMYDANLSSSMRPQVSAPNGVEFLFNSNHCFLRAATVESKDASNVHVALNVISHDGATISGFIERPSSSQVHTAGSGYTDGLAQVVNSASTAFKRDATVYIQVSGGAIQDFTVVDPGNGFTASNYQIVQGSANTGRINVDVATTTSSTTTPSLPIRPKHGIATFELNTSSPPGSTQDITELDFTNCSLVSDMFKISPAENASSSFGARPYFLMSKTVGPTRSLSGNIYLANSSRSSLSSASTSSIVASHFIGQQSLDFVGDFYSGLENQFSLLDGVSRITALTAGSFRVGLNQLRSNIDVSANYDASSSPAADLSISSDQLFVGTTLDIILRDNRPYPTISTGRKALIGGGSLFCFDGDQLFENNFFEGPAVRTLIHTTRHAKGSDTLTGSFTYAFTFSAVDAANDLHESPVFTSEPQTGLNQSIVVGEIYITDATRRKLTGARRPTLNIFRTAAAGQIFFKLTSIDLEKDVEKIVFIDGGQNELDIEAPLYTSSGEAENLTTGAVTDIIEYKGKLVTVGAKNICFVSKPSADGFSFGFPIVAPFQIRTPDPSDPITIIEQNMDSLMISTSQDVFGVFGEGPNAIGQGPFTNPKLVGANKGAIADSPHINTSIGVFYISLRGIYLVKSNYQFEYIGAPCEDLLSGFTIKAMAVKESRNEIMFLLKKSTSSRILIYNSLFKQWYSWDLAIDTTAINQVNDMMFDPEKSSLILLQSNGALAIDTEKVPFQDEFYDSVSGGAASSTYDMSFKLHSIAAAGLQGAQRVYRVMLLGEFQSSHTLTMDIFNSYDSSYTERHQQTISSDTNPYQFRAHLNNQKNRAIAINVDLRTPVAGGGAKLSGVAFEVGARPDTFKLPKTQTVPEV